jgi:DNA processing protein
VVRGEPWVDEIAGSADLAHEWRRRAALVDPLGILRELRALAISVADRNSPSYPRCLLGDPEPPAVLFADGDLRAVGERRVAVVGTRNCTRYGVEIAAELGELLAANGVTVVSGLALGIDGAAHAGALRSGATPPVAVVAGGLDRPYPAQNRALWSEVARVGVVLSEAPLGVRPERWRFPARNRIIAGLAEVVVVVESDVAGGSMYTVAEALARDRPVCAVPGSIRSAASRGTNRLLAEGGHVLAALDDVFGLLDLVAVERPAVEPVEVPAGTAGFLDAIGWQPATVEQVMESLGATIDDTALALERLLAAGLVARRGAWYERCAVPTRSERPGESRGSP